jgi:hypothetical protein
MHIDIRDIVMIAAKRPRRAPRRVSPVLLAALGMLALSSAAPALAVEGHAFSASFNGGSGHALSGPDGVAINQATGQVYVADSKNNRVEIFSSSGEWEKAFGTAGSGAKGGEFKEPGEIAVDNSGGLTKGDVAVVDGGNKRVQVFNAEGTYLREISKTEINAVVGAVGTKGGLEGIAGVAIDSSGNVWIWTVKNTPGGGLASMYELPVIGSLEFKFENFTSAGAIAVTPAGDILAGDATGAIQYGPTGEELEGVGFALGEFGGVPGLALDPGNEGVYLDRGVEVAHFPAPTSGAAGRSDLFGTSGAGKLSAGSGIAVNGLTHDVYVADSAANLVDVYAPVTPLASASLNAPAKIQETTVELSGEVNPEGVAVSACEFEYGTQIGQYTKTAACSPLPGSSSASEAVSAKLTGLMPGEHYYARLSVTNAKGTSYAQQIDAFRTVFALEIAKEGSGSVECAIVTTGAHGKEIGPYKECEYGYFGFSLELALKANPDLGFEFVEWKDGAGGAVTCDGLKGECEFEMGFGPTKITAVFNREGQKIEKYALKVQKTGTGRGTIVSTNTAGIDCLPTQAECTHEYPEAETVELEEKPEEPNSEFVKWEGCESEPGGKCVVKMSGAKTVKAEFNLSATKAVPAVVTEPASGVEAGLEAGHSTASATLHGKVTPNGLPLTSCEFEYGTSTSYEEKVECEPAAKNIPATGETAVTATVSLAPDTTYHYRLRAANANGEGAPGGDQAFPTPGSGIGETFTVKVTDTSARLNASIDPDKAPTSYRFEYDTREYKEGEGSHGASAPISAVAIGAGEAPVPVGETVQGLAPSTTYYYRAVAVSELEVHGAPTAVEFYGPEEAFTTEPAGGEFKLPDYRAYEMVSPPQKQGALIAEHGINLSSPIMAEGDGGAFTYIATTPTEVAVPGVVEEVQVLSTRTPVGWQTRDLGLPHGQATSVPLGSGEEYRKLSSDLSSAVVQPFGRFTPCTSSQGAPQPCPSPAASEQTAFLEDLRGEAFTPLVTGCPGVGEPCPNAVREHADVPPGTPFGSMVSGSAYAGRLCTEFLEQYCGPFFIAATPDLSHVVLRSLVGLTEGEGGGGGLYEWSGGKLAFIGRGEEPEEKGTNGQLYEGEYAAHGEHGISEDGSRVIFAGKSENAKHEPVEGLLMRDTVSDETVRLGEGQFQDASADDSRVFFDTAWNAQLEGGKNRQPPSGQLDVFEVTSHRGEPLAGRVTELTDHQGVRGIVLGASEDGSYVYFVSDGVLAAGARPGTCKRRFELDGSEGACNLYVDHYEAESEKWTPTFIVRLSEGAYHDWGEASGNGSWPGGATLSHQPARVSPDGRWLAFMDQASLTGNDNRDASTGQAAAEVYLYHDATGGGAGTLTCASCEPTGARPAAEEYRQAGEDQTFRGWPDEALVAADVPGWRANEGVLNLQGRQPRYLSNEGRLFFNSYDALVPQDQNGTWDVYEYEPRGVPAGEHACSAASANGSDVFEPARPYTVEGHGGESEAGCVGLISSGNSSAGSAFMEASESGGDVFFLTAARLLPEEDRDSALDVYDAHECTSASPCLSQPVSSPPCDDEASCKSSPTPQPSIYGVGPSETFNGPGNLAPPPGAVVKKPPLTRAQKLVKALKVCGKDRERAKRKRCERRARKRYGDKASKAKRASGKRGAKR